jgi:predicted amidophosphoribosyltransferase
MEPEEGATTTTCPNCGADVERDEERCPSCSVPLQVLCPECGAHAPADDDLCPACGTSLAQATEL